MNAAPNKNLVAMGLILAVVIGLGGAFSIGWSFGTRPVNLPSILPSLLHADSASGGKAVSTATGRIDDDLEGLFILDHLTGNLICVMISPRTGLEAGIYQANVTTQLGADKIGDLDFVMTTGFNAFGSAGRTDNRRPAQCVCYVVEGNSGRALGYSLSFNRTGLQQGVVQNGQLDLIWQGSFRADNIRRN